MKFVLILFFPILFFSCSNSSNEFELCGLGILRPYYYPQLNYEGEFYAIKEAYKEKYREVISLNNTGIIKIRFHVNCQGETGNFLVETYSLDYEPYTLDVQISDQLLKITQGLNGWIAAIDEDGETVNSHKFLSFRVVDGKIINILPK